jgi:hypothetical protein
MWWAIIIVALILLGYVLYKRIAGTTTLRVKKDQLDLKKEIVGINLEEIKKQKKIIDKATRKGKTVSLSSLAESFEEAKSKYQGPDKPIYDAYVDNVLKKLGEKYGPEIPIAVVHKISEGSEDL